MGKLEVVQFWKSELKAVGFLYKNSMFQFSETEKHSLQFIISVQKHQRAETYKVNPTIAIKSPLFKGAKAEVLVMGNLREDGIRLHVTTKSWWALEFLGEALAKLKCYAIPWFRSLGNASLLAEKVEVSIRDHKSLIDILEPLTQNQEDAMTRAWPQQDQGDRRTPPVTLYHASILHYLAGDLERAVSRTEDWLTSITPNERDDKANAKEQLSTLKHIRSQVANS